LQRAYPNWSDERIYQIVKKYVTAEIQKITYYEYLPSLLGDYFPTYTGYDPTVNVDIHAFFGVVAQRYGHSAINAKVAMIDPSNFNITQKLQLREYFFNPEALEEGGSSQVLLGTLRTRGSEIDQYIVTDMRNYLFGDGNPRFDLPAFNMMRAWDFGLPFYNDVRVAYGLPWVYSWDEFPTYVPGAKEKLSQVYLDPSFVDPWIGGLLDAHYPGSSLSPLFHYAVVDQFKRVRDGDRFYWENMLDELNGPDYQLFRPIEQTSMAHILRENTLCRYVQNDVFHYMFDGRTPLLPSDSN